MNKHKLVLLLIISLVISSCISNSPNYQTKIIDTPILQNISTIIPASITSPAPTATHTVVPTEIPQHPAGQLILHKADSDIKYVWFSYLPSNLDKNEKVNILIGGVFGAYPPTDDYDSIIDTAQEVAKGYINTAIDWNYVYLLPVLPRSESNHVYTVAFDWKTFLNTTDEFSQRPDLVVNKMIDKLIRDLQADGYQAHSKIFLEGYSAGAMFSQRYALLHPERIQAIAVGQSGGSIVIPETHYQNVKLYWPAGVYDFTELSGMEFDRVTYMQIPQYIYIGSEDTTNSTLWGTGELWRTQAQIDIMNTYFGYNDPDRLRSECEYLVQLGYNVIFKEYPDVGHSYTTEMQIDVLEFFEKYK